MEFVEKCYSEDVFSGMEMTQEVLSNITFWKCQFKNCDFSDVECIENCTFDECEFQGAKLNGVELRNSAFLNCKFQFTVFFGTWVIDCKMTGSDLAESDCIHLEIRGGDWSFTNLRYLQFKKQDFQGTRFFGADLTGAGFHQCNLKDCALDEAVIHATSFYASDLRGATIFGIDISNANLKKAKLDLNQCVFIAELLTEGKYTI